MTQDDWADASSHVLGMLIHAGAADERDERGRPIGGRRILLLVNGGPRSRSFTLPKDGGAGTWEQLLDTARAGTRLVKTPALNLVAHSLVLLRHGSA
jgi:pullulanase/glycogen debranching enzyme